jgi:hypothetical protein
MKILFEVTPKAGISVGRQVATVQKTSLCLHLQASLKMEAVGLSGKFVPYV